MKILFSYDIIITALLLISVIGISIITVPESFAYSFSYNDQIRYATLSEKMVGHVIASYENLNKNVPNNKLAQLHMTHPFEEEFDSMNYFYSKYMNFQNKAEYILYFIANTDTTDRELFDKQAKEIFFLTKQGKNIIIDNELQSNRYFNLITASSLLEESKIELMDSVNASGDQSLLKYQDAFGFAVRAHMIVDNIQDIPSKLKNDINSKFIKLFFAFGNSNDVKKIMQIEEEIITEIYEFVIEHKPTFVDPDIEPIEKERTVLAKINNIANEELVIFVGENFPKNSILKITYFSSNNPDPFTVDAKTTSKGEFSIPIEFTSDNHTYFVQVTCSEITTSHILAV